MITEEAVRAVLTRILDPEYGISIVELGMLTHVDIQGGEVHVGLTLTTPSCPAGNVILEGARSALAAMPGVEVADVYLAWDPPWTPDRLSMTARRQLGWEG